MSVSRAAAPPEWIDYFVSPLGFYYDDLLPFAIGSAAFDNWLLWKASTPGSPIIDGFGVTTVVYQSYDYSHHVQGQEGVREGAGAYCDRELMGGWHHCFFLSDATHGLTTNALRLSLRYEYFRLR